VRDPSVIIRSSVVCEGQVLQLGAQEWERKREGKEDLLAKRADKNCMLTLINHKHSYVDVALERG
jgi:hypothetical protein